ncbi:MAG: GC-type dockerin domain-anchored protein [Planctomycetota bacterium]
MTRTAITLAAAGLLIPASFAAGNDAENRLTNPSFEDADPFLPFLPDGWGDIPQDVPVWSDEFARTGVRSLEIPAPTFTSFIGWTTNIFDSGGNLFDPLYEYEGGDYVVSGYYMIPGDDPLAPSTETAPYDIVGVKVELRRVPPNFSIYQAFEYTIGDVTTTNGEWVYFEAVLTPDEVSPDFPPFPGSATIVPFRFRVGGTPTPQGTIYWDDLCVIQRSTDPTCVADVTTSGTNPGNTGFGVPDGNVDVSDLTFFVEIWLGGDVAADVTTSGTNPGDAGFGVPDGNVDVTDLTFFVESWITGCP